MLSYWRKFGAHYVTTLSHSVEPPHQRRLQAGWEGKQRRPAHAEESGDPAEIGRVATF